MSRRSRANSENLIKKSHSNSSMDEVSANSPKMSLLKPSRSTSVLKDPSGLGDVGELQKKVFKLVLDSGLLPHKHAKEEVSWYFGHMGIDAVFFKHQKPEELANHVIAIYGSKVTARAKGDKANFTWSSENEKGAVYFHTSNGSGKASNWELVLDDRFLDKEKELYRLETFRSDIVHASQDTLRCYFIQKCEFDNLSPVRGETDLKVIGNKEFLLRTTPEHLEMLQKLMVDFCDPNQRGCLIDSRQEEEGTHVVRIVFKKRTVNQFFASLSDLYHHYKLYSTRKYVEQFSNGVTIISLFLRSGETLPNDLVLKNIYHMCDDISLFFAVPQTPLIASVRQGDLSVSQATYAYCAGIFAEHFFNRLGKDYEKLVRALDDSDEIHQTLLDKLRKRFRKVTMPAQQIWDLLRDNPDIVIGLYGMFKSGLDPRDGSRELKSPKKKMQPNRQRSASSVPKQTEEELRGLLKKLKTEERKVFEMFFLFNSSVLKTNFFKDGKTAISFRLDPSFLPVSEYKDPLYGMFLVVGGSFRGFHLRFRDISRGGIRMVRSRNIDGYNANKLTLFDENYNLAHTQERKNKDIAEGGAKGTILMDSGASNLHCKVAFKKYIAAMLDLLKPDPEIVSEKFSKEEILFFGPDEGTADFMDWASRHAKQRGFVFWKALTTGKSVTVGGIPHDLYGMTTRSVHQYVLGILGKLGLKESEVTKIQTGGPDGDLGSNEILISSDKTIAIVDGSGVLYDPVGINREELCRCAKERVMIDHFDISKLSEKGFRVLIDEKERKLPDGTIVDGMHFRNTFHLNPLAKSEMFVPCGGRPSSVDVNNVKHLYDEQGLPKFKVIVEGANLFFTEAARQKLQKDGVILYKDASANKGGVTSSSLEVLCSLSLSDEQYLSGMCVSAEGKVPELRANYVKQVQDRIEENARLEFHCIWDENQRNGTSFSDLSNALSNSINKLTGELKKSAVWEDKKVRDAVLIRALPSVLLDFLGLETILERVPDNYLRALFASYLASTFVYKHGIGATHMEFFQFMGTLTQ